MASAQHPSEEALAEPASASEVIEAPDSPRAAVRAYLEHTRRGDFAQAARFLDLSAPDAQDGARLARELKAVLDAHAWLVLATISPLSTGDTEDGLGSSSEEIARIPSAGGASEPVLLVRRPGRNLWLFSRSTVQHVPAWYEGLSHHWLLDHVPAALLRPGPHELLWWQWMALPLVGLLSWLLGVLLSKTMLRVLSRVTARTTVEWDDALVARLGGPLTLWSALAVAYLALPNLSLYLPAEEFVLRGLRATFLIGLFWAFSRSTDMAASLLARSPWAAAHPASVSLIPLGARVLKVAILAVGLVTMLSQLGYPVASLLAGLGIGGLALALAAQKTVENLFGAFSIGADQPFREGDFVRIEDFVGTVEQIGLRSTKVRTLDRTLITIPNGKLAEMRLESFSVRDRIRLACTIGLVYETTSAQMRAVLAGIEQALRSHPKIWPEAVVVRFKELGASSLDIEIMAWFQTADWGEFQVMRQDLLLTFMEIVEGAGTSFAFPTRTVHVVGPSPAT